LEFECSEDFEKRKRGLRLGAASCYANAIYGVGAMYYKATQGIGCSQKTHQRPNYLSNYSFQTLCCQLHPF
ncbi:hypothetical protein, partial [Rubritalea sp.]|uniref:hypothetical protein n=1 Tax=Rubritalea sp. TaxID=2109375 RepID=UPI003EF1E59F